MSPVIDGILLGRLDPVHHEAGFVMFVIGCVQVQLAARFLVSPQVFAEAGHVVGDQGIGGIQDIRGRTIVLFKSVQSRRREILLEALHVFHAGAAKTVNGLIIIADRK